MRAVYKLIMYGGAAAFMLGCAFWLSCRFVQHRAQALLSVLEQAQVGQPNEAEMSQLRTRFREFVSLDDVSGDHGSTEDVLFTFSNRPLSMTHLAPPRFVNIGLTVKQGILVSKFVKFKEDNRCGITVQNSIYIYPPGQALPHRVSISRDSHSRVVNVIVEDASTAPVAQIAMDWRLHVSRLSSFGSRVDGADLYPELYCGN